MTLAITIFVSSLAVALFFLWIKAVELERGKAFRVWYATRSFIDYELVQLFETLHKGFFYTIKATGKAVSHLSFKLLVIVWRAMIHFFEMVGRTVVFISEVFKTKVFRKKEKHLHRNE